MMNLFLQSLVLGTGLSASRAAAHSLTPQELAEHPLLIPGPMAPPTTEGEINSMAVEQLLPLAYTPLPLGSITPGGWLLSEMNNEANGLAGSLHSFYRYVKQSSWTGGTEEYSGLNEGFPYWFNGIVPLAYQLNDPDLISAVESAANNVISRQGEDGWLGPETPNHRTFWGRYPFCLGLIQMAEASTTMRPTILTALTNFTTGMNKMLHKNYTNYIMHPNDTLSASDYTWGRVRACDMWITLQWLVENDPNANNTILFDNMELLRRGGLDWGAWYNAAAYVFKDFYLVPQSTTDDNYHYIHGVNVAQGLKAQAVAHRFTHNATLLDDVANAFNWTYTYHGASSGNILADEREDGLNPYYGAELCTAVEAMYSLSVMYQTLGNNEYADMAERATFNAMPAMITMDWWAHQYMSQANQPYSKNLTGTPFYNVNTYGQTYGMEPNYPCCTVNHGQGLPKYVSASWTKSGDNGLVHSLLGPSSVQTTLQSGATSINCTTNYPFGYTFMYDVQSDGPFDFYIRVPGWADASTSTLTVNGQSMTAQADASTGLQRVSVQGVNDKIEYNIGASIRTEARSNDTIAIYHGALLYALELGTAITSTMPRQWNNMDQFYEAGYAPEKARDYQITNTTAWNIAIDPSTISYKANDSDSATLSNMAFAPGAPPQYMTAWACEIDWPLFVSVPGSAPPLARRKCLGGAKLVRLVPYGSAKIRMGEIPTIELNM